MRQRGSVTLVQPCAATCTGSWDSGGKCRLANRWSARLGDKVPGPSSRARGTQLNHWAPESAEPYARYFGHWCGRSCPTRRTPSSPRAAREQNRGSPAKGMRPCESQLCLHQVLGQGHSYKAHSYRLGERQSHVLLQFLPQELARGPATARAAGSVASVHRYSTEGYST